MKKLWFGLTVLVLVGFATLSCNIGLGAAVDTQPPEVKVERPEVGAVIRGSFAIAGQFSDDGTIKKPEEGGLTVVLERTDGTGSKYTYTGSIDSKAGTWTCVIDPATEGKVLVDGEYQATITMVDTFEHSTVKTNTFTIDNTAPIVVLQRPSAKKGSSSADSYGQSFTLEGQAADDNNVSSVVVNIYEDEECTKPVHTVTLSNVPPTIELDVAKFVEGASNDYSKIYGTNTKVNAVTKNFYCQIVAYDGAQKYPADGSAQTDADKKGNSTNHYYLYEEISASILNDYKITEVYHMNNGTYTGGEDSTRAATISSVKTILAENKVTTGYFSLNPANNPTFVVSGRNTLTKDGHDFDAAKLSDWEISSGTKVQVEISTGLDGIPLVGDTLGVYVIECDANGNPKSGAAPIQIISPKTDKDGKAILTDETAIATRAALIAKSGTSYKFTTLLDATINSALQFSHTYIFGVNGYDEKGNEVSGFGKAYGFYFVSNGSAPKVDVTSPSNGLTYLKKGSAVEVKGSAQADVSYPNLTISVLDANGATVYSKAYASANMGAGTYGAEITCGEVNNRKKIDFVHTIPKEAFSQTVSGQYTLSVLASNGEKDTTVDRIIMYDVEGPVITIDTLLPEADKYKISAGLANPAVYDATFEDGSKEAGKYLNGIVTLKLSLVDDYDVVCTDTPAAGQEDHRPYFEITKGGVAQSFKVDGSATAVTKQYITTPAKQSFKIDTSDIADGSSVKVRVCGWDRAGNAGTVAEKDYIVDQKTDKPVLLPKNATNLTFAMDSQTALNNQGAGTKKNILSSGSNLALSLIDDDGIYNYKFEIGKADGAADPTITVPGECDTLNGGQYSGAGIYPVGSPSEIAFTYTLPTVAGNYLCQMTITDSNTIATTGIAPQTTTKKFWILVTSAAPDVTVNILEPQNKTVTLSASNTTSTATKSFKNEISIASENGPFKITRREKLADDPVTYNDVVVATNLSGNTFTDTNFTPASGRNENKVTYIVQDTYSTSLTDSHVGTRTISYNIDNSAPSISTFTSIPDVSQTERTSHLFTAEGSDDIAAANKYDANTKKTGETVSGIAKVQYTFDSAKADANVVTVTDDRLSQTIVFGDDPAGFDHTIEGKKKIYVRAIDAVGNIGAWAEKEFTYDTAKPTVTFGKYDTTDISGNTFDIGKTFKLSGTAADNYGIKSVTLTESKDGAAAQPVTVEGTTSWSVPKLPKSGNAVTGTYTYVVTVTDSADKTETATLIVNIDTEAPSFTISSPAENDILSGSSTVFGGTVNDGTNSANQGVKGLYYAITDSATAPTQAVTDTSVWTFIAKETTGISSANWDLIRNLGTGKSGAAANTVYEGKKYLHMKAEDKAGNVTATAKTVLFYVDQGLPEITDVKYEKDASNSYALTENDTYFFAGATPDQGQAALNYSFKITGNVLESNEFTEFEYSLDGAAAQNIVSNNSTLISATKQAWSKSLTGLTPDATHTIKITAKDAVARTKYVEKEYSFFQDTKAPDIVITNPDADIDGENALNSAKYTFRANVSDAGSGLENKTYKYTFTQTPLADLAAVRTAASGWTDYNSQAFMKEMDTASGNTNVAGKLCEGKWYLYIYAKDAVGHDSYAVRTFWVDLTKPKVTTKTTGRATAEAVQTDKTYEFEGDLAKDITQKTDFKVYYKAEDTHGMHATTPYTVVVKKGDTTLVKDTGYTLSASADGNGFYSITLKNPTDGDYTYSITAKDLAGKTTTVTRTVRLDTTGPVVSITSPDDFTAWQTTSTVKIMGNATDATGTAKVYYALNPATAPVRENVTKDSLTATGTIWTAATNTSNWNFTMENVPDSATNKLYIIAIDTKDNLSASIVEKTLKVDATAPTLDETDIGMSGKSFLNGTNSITISGTYVEATSGVKSITVKDDKNANSSWTATPSSGTWTTSAIAFGTGDNKLTNGVHTLNFTIEDTAGNIGKLQRSITIDTTKPTHGALSVETTEKYTENSRNWYDTSSIDIKLLGVTDSKTDNYASGIKAVEYQVVTSGVAAADATWIAMAAQADTTTYTAKANCTVQGLNTINVRVTDNAGNVTNAGPLQVYIDTGYPTKPTATQYWVELADTATANAAQGYSDQLLTNQTKKVHVLLITEDANASGTFTSSGIKEITYGSDASQKVTGTTNFTPTGGSVQTVYDLAIAANNVVNGSCTIKITDNVGNTTEFSPFTVKVDTTAPTLKLEELADADTETTAKDINKWVKLNVSVTDDLGFNNDDIVLKYYTKTAAGTYGTGTTIALTKTSMPWTADFNTDTPALNASPYIKFELTGKDKAGNAGTTVTQEYYINQDSDRPKITLTNLNTTGMTSSNQVYLTGTSTLYGLVSDDDGAVSAMQYKKSSDAEWTNVTVTNGSFSITNLAEGAGTYLFKVTDSGYKAASNSNVFTSSTNGGPKLIGSDNAKFTTDTQLYMKVDVKNPTLSNVQVQAYSDSTTRNGSLENAGSNCVVGGVSKNIIEIVLTGSDTNGIKGAALKLKQGSVEKTYRTSTAIDIEGISTWTAVKAGSASGNNYTWTTDKLNLSTLGFVNGTVDVTAYIIDNAGSETNKTYTFSVDTTAPEFTISSPNRDGMTFYGIQSNTFGGSVTGAIDVAKIEYAITNSAAAPNTGWTQAAAGIASAQVIFDGKKDAADDTKYETGHAKKLKEFLTAAEQAADDNKTYYLHFKATDNCGNSKVTSRSIVIIPNGDKPTVTVTTPVSAQKVAGSIRIFGSTEIAADSVDAVYVEVDPTYVATAAADKGFTSGWKTEFQGITSLYNSNIVEYASGKYGIKAEGTNIFSLIINKENELNIVGEARNCAIKVVAVSTTNKKVSDPVIIPFEIDPNPPQITSVEVVQLDSSNNVIKSMPYTSGMWLSGNWWLRFNAHDDSGIKTLTVAEIGNTTVTKKVITAGAVASDTMTAGNGSDNAITKTEYAGKSSSTSAKNWTIMFPLATGTGQGEREFKIDLVENTDNNFNEEKSIKIKYDNTAPLLGNSKHADYNMNPIVQQSNGFYTLKGYASDTGGSGIERVAFYFVRRTGTPRVFDPMWKQSSTQNKTVALSYMSYSDGLFWKQKTVTRPAAEKIVLSEADDNIHKGGLVKLDGAIYRIEDLSADGKTVTINASPSTSITTAYFAMALVVDNSKTESGSGDKVTSGYREGYYQTITQDDGDGMYESLTIDEASNAGQWSASINSANIPDGNIEIHYVAFDKAQNYSCGIVGNVAWDTYKAYTTADATAVASLTPNANTTAETGSFIYAYNSDKPAYVSNNAPRIVSVTVGCDYNGDGSYSDTEKVTKYVDEAYRQIGGNRVKRATGVTQHFIASSDGTSTGGGVMEIKAASQVEIEMIGGNGNIYLQYSVDGSYTEHSGISSSSFTKYGGATATPILASTATRGTEAETPDQDNSKYWTGTTLAPIALGEDYIKGKVASNTSKAAPTWFTFELWDSTEETTVFTNSQNAFIKLPLAIQLYDNEAPKTVINNLYWNGSDDNSVYKNPTTDKLEGHVELKNYLGSGFTNANYGNDDDKVSGKVVFRGYAYDNKRLARINWGITSTKGDKTDAKQAWPQLFSRPVYYSVKNKKWAEITKDRDDTTKKITETQTTTYNNASGNSTIDNPFFYFRVYDDAEHGAYLNEKGHRVYWELTIDTSCVQEPGQESFGNAWGLGKDLVVWVEAVDASGNATNLTEKDSNNANITLVTSGTDETALYRPNYKVDVVPYVTGVKSRLGSTADDNRSSSGRYQIASGESIELIGYNLKQGSANLPITAPTSVGTYTHIIEKTITNTETKVTFPIINNINDNSTVGGITNSTEAGKVKNKYNMQPSTYNQSLTDDVAFDIWQINNRAARTYDGVAFVQEPVMKYNPSNGLLGFAFSNGASRCSMPGSANGTAYSNRVWEYNYASYSNNALAISSSGVAYGISIGLDTQPSNGKAGRMNLFSSQWGRSNTTSQSGNFDDNTNSIHLDAIGTGGATIIEKRFSNTNLALAEHSNDPVLYLAYYDLVRDEIIFRYGHMKATKSDTDSANNGQFVTGGTGESGFAVNANYRSAIAGGDTGQTPGEYLDLAVIPGSTSASDVVCAVWYNGGSLKYSYKYNPCNDNDMYSGSKYGSGTGTNPGYWSEPQTLITNGGQYCKVETDANGGVHIAAYDQTKKGVAYIYLPTYNTTYAAATHYHLIDAQNGPYDEIGLDVAVSKVNTSSDTTGKATPTISYYANGTPKMAVYTTGFTQNSQPAASWNETNNSFTGNWDVCYVPTASRLLKDHINVVLPKSGTGVLGTQTTTSTFTTDNSGSGAQTQSSVSDNKTNNPVVGYAIRNGSYGYMEIAQRQ